MSKIARYLEKFFKKFGNFDHSIFNQIYLYFVDNLILYYDTLKHYQDRVEPPLKRQISYHGTSMFLVSVMIKFLLLTWFDEDFLKIMTGDILYNFTTYYRKGYIFFSNLIALTLLIRAVVFYHEKKLKIYNNEIITINNGGNIFKYNNNENSLLIIANSVDWLKNGFIIHFYVTAMICIILTVYVYIFSEIHYNILVLMIFTTQLIIFIKIIYVSYAGYIMFVAITFIFLKLKQNEIIKSIKLNVLWRNKFRLYDNLKDYHQLTKLVNKLGKLINVICGIIYLFIPLFISQILWILNDVESKNNMDIIAQGLFITGVSALFIIIYIFVDIMSNITQAKRTLPKYLYPIFHEKQFTRFEHRISLNLNYNFGQLSDIMVRIKIDSFIARLNKEFVGFYFLYLFKVTKLTFLKLIYMLMSDFVLIQDF